MQKNKLTLVLGATGKTGRRVAERLTKQGIPVRIGSRSAEPRFDWDDRSTWQAALDGVASVYVSFYPDLAFPGASETIQSFVGQAVKSGVHRLVLLSGRGEEGAMAGEQAVQNSGVEWTIVRSSWFNQNFSEGHFLESILAGEVAFPVDNVAEPFIDVDDIADMAVAALTEDKHAGQLYEVTGPRLLTFADAVAEIAKASGRTISYVPVTPEQYAAGLAEHGVPADFAEPLLDLITTVLDGRNSHLSDGVRRALGREPKDFSVYARETAATGVWS